MGYQRRVHGDSQSVGKMALAAFLLTILGLSPLASAASWNYSDTDAWGFGGSGDFGDCITSTNQSPINISTADAMHRDMSNFSISIGNKIATSGTIKNTGYSVQYYADETHGASIMGGPLNASYIFNQFHLHWGSVVGQGSEHCIDSYCYDAELHLVHYNSVYDNISHAVGGAQPNGLAVVGILIKEITDFDQFNVKDSESVTNLKKAVLKLAGPQRGSGDAETTLSVRTGEFISAIGDLTGLYHYEGGLTTPNCNEIVQWLVYDKPLYVQKNGLVAALRMLKDEYGDYMSDNFRPLQSNTNQLYHYM